MNHTGIIANCVSCHNGRAAPAKPIKHIITNDSVRDLPQEHRDVCRRPARSLPRHRAVRQLPQRHDGYGQVAQAFRHDSALRNLPPDHDVDAGDLPAHVAGLCESRARRSSCTSCHTSNAQTVPWKFPAFRPDCASCHADKYRPMSHLKFERPVQVYYTVMELRDCAGACHIYTDNTQRTILTRRTGVHRAIGGGW